MTKSIGKGLSSGVCLLACVSVGQQGGHLKASVACASFVATVTCGLLQAGASAVRAQQRGYRNFKQNAADAVLTAGTFGLVGLPLQNATSSVAQAASGLAADFIFGAAEASCQAYGSSC